MENTSFPKFANGFNSVALVETSYLNSDMYKESKEHDRYN